MTFTSGFFNSLAGDRLYDATQLSSIFDGVIRDGVYLGVGNAFAVTSTGALNISVGTGRAWFNRTWSLNDAGIPITLDASEAILNRVDTVILEINTTSGVRANTIKVLKSAPASSYSNIVSPVVPSNGGVYQYKLAEIQRDAGSTSITQAKIQNFVGTASTPYVSGILETFSTNAITAQFESKFDTWFADVQTTLSGDTAGNLLAKINTLQAEVDALEASLTQTDTGWVNASFYTPNGFKQNTAADKLQWRKRNNNIRIRGAGVQTVSGSNFNNGIMVGMPASPQTQHVGIGQWQTGGFAHLIILAGSTEIIADSTGAQGTFGIGWIRMDGGYEIDPW